MPISKARQLKNVNYAKEFIDLDKAAEPSAGFWSTAGAYVASVTSWFTTDARSAASIDTDDAAAQAKEDAESALALLKKVLNTPTFINWEERDVYLRVVSQAEEQINNKQFQQAEELIDNNLDQLTTLHKEVYKDLEVSNLRQIIKNNSESIEYRVLDERNHPSPADSQPSTTLRSFPVKGDGDCAARAFFIELLSEGLHTNNKDLVFQIWQDMVEKYQTAFNNASQQDKAVLQQFHVNDAIWSNLNRFMADYDQVEQTAIGIGTFESIYIRQDKNYDHHEIIEQLTPIFRVALGSFALEQLNNNRLMEGNAPLSITDLMDILEAESKGELPQDELGHLLREREVAQFFKPKGFLSLENVIGYLTQPKFKVAGVIYRQYISKVGGERARQVRTDPEDGEPILTLKWLHSGYDAEDQDIGNHYMAICDMNEITQATFKQEAIAPTASVETPIVTSKAPFSKVQFVTTESGEVVEVEDIIPGEEEDNDTAYDELLERIKASPPISEPKKAEEVKGEEGFYEAEDLQSAASSSPSPELPLPELEEVESPPVGPESGAADLQQAELEKQRIAEIRSYVLDAKDVFTNVQKNVFANIEVFKQYNPELEHPSLDLVMAISQIHLRLEQNIDRNKKLDLVELYESLDTISYATGSEIIELANMSLQYFVTSFCPALDNLMLVLESELKNSGSQTITNAALKRLKSRFEGFKNSLPRTTTFNLPAEDVKNILHTHKIQVRGNPQAALRAIAAKKAATKSARSAEKKEQRKRRTLQFTSQAKSFDIGTPHHPKVDYIRWQPKPHIVPASPEDYAALKSAESTKENIALIGPSGGRNILEIGKDICRENGKASDFRIKEEAENHNVYRQENKTDTEYKKLVGTLTIPPQPTTPLAPNEPIKLCNLQYDAAEFDNTYHAARFIFACAKEKIAENPAKQKTLSCPIEINSYDQARELFLAYIESFPLSEEDLTLASYDNDIFTQYLKLQPTNDDARIWLYAFCADEKSFADWLNKSQYNAAEADRLQLVRKHFATHIGYGLSPANCNGPNQGFLAGKEWKYESFFSRLNPFKKRHV